MGLGFLNYNIILIICIAAYLFYQFEWQRARAILFALMLKAKILYIQEFLKTGVEQENWVIEQASNELPYITKKLMNKNVLRSIVHELYLSVKDDLGQKT